jgi:N-acetyl-gamma-glutamyl-phosphate reductase
MLVSIPLFLDRLASRPTAADITTVLTDFYTTAARIDVTGAPENLEPEILNGTDRLEIFVAGAQGQAVLIARLDNLGKGASGAAVQNIALMLGLPDPLNTMGD